MAQDEQAQGQPGIVRTSWRIDVAFVGDEFTVVSAERVPMVAPGAASPPRRQAGPMSGAWLALVRQGENEPRWVRGIQQPNRADREAFTPGGGITRVKRDTVQGQFELIVPDFAPEATLVLYASPSAAPERAAESRLKLTREELERLERSRRKGGDQGQGRR